ncbi:MAG: tyrosine-type recombinase/integrase [Anaerolineales bacterium]
MNIIRQYVLWIDVQIEMVDHNKIGEYTDHLLYRRLKPKTINCHLACIRVFYDYMHHEEGIDVKNPVKRGSALRMPSPLPKHLRDEEVVLLFDSIKKLRDEAMFRIMLRCGLRVDEVANLYISDLDLKHNKIFVRNGKGQKDRVVYVSPDAYAAIVNYLRVRPLSEAKKLFLVEKGSCLGKPISVRGIQKRIEYYSRITGIDVSCHQLRHTMATQMLNADAEIETIQDLLGHNAINTTERYCTVSNLKVMRDYFKAMDVIMKRTSIEQLKEKEYATNSM